MLIEVSPAAGTGIRAILVVDDDAAMRRALVRLLQHDGHRVESAANGREGLAKLQAQDYDYILCDLHMPALDGPGMYRDVEQRAPHLCRRFVFITGDALSSEAATFLRQVPVPYLTKPFTAMAIRRLINPPTPA